MPQTQSKERKLTISLPADLAERLNAERARIGKETGLRVSMNQVATRAMRAGFEATSKR